MNGPKKKNYDMKILLALRICQTFLVLTWTGNQIAEIAGGALIKATPAMPFKTPQTWAEMVINKSPWFILFEESNCNGIHLIAAPNVRHVTHSNIECLW